MRFLLGLICIAIMTVAITGCDDEKLAEDQAAAPAVAEPVVTEQEAEPLVPVAEPITAVPQEKETLVVPTDPDVVVMTVNGEPIKNAAIMEEVNKRVEAMQSRMPEGRQVSESQKQNLRMSVEEALAQKTVLAQELAKKNITVSDDDVMAEMAKIAEANGQTLDEVKAEIVQYGMTFDDLKSQVRPQVEMKALADSCLEDPEMQAEAKKFYDENPAYFEVPEQVRASHVLIKVEPAATEEEKAAAKAKAEEVLAKAKAGDDFAALAKEYSDDPGSKDNGGEYTFGRGRMVKPFEDTAFALEPGQVSDLVETQFGYHIIKLSEKTEASKTPFEEAQEKITSYLLQQQMRENAKIEYSEAEQAFRDAIKQQQQMMQQQMMQQQIQAQMAQQQAQTEKAEEDNATESTESAAEPTE